MKRIPLLTAVLLALALLPAEARAAADWQWTQGQGWSEGTGSPRETPADQLRYAYGLEQKGEFLDAAKQYFLLLKTYSHAQEAGIALQRLAKCLFEMESYYQAFQAIEQVVESYPASGKLADLLAIELKIAQKLAAGARPSILDDREDPLTAGRRAAVEVYEAILKHDPFGPLADDVCLALGDTHLALNDTSRARDAYAKLVNEFSKSPLVDRARLGMTKCDVLDGKASTGEVEHMVREIRGKEKTEGKKPEDAGQLEESVSELEELEAEKMWRASEFYLRRGTPESVGSAVWTLNELVRRFPKTGYADKAREILPQIKIPTKKGYSPIDLARLDLNPLNNNNKKKKNKPAFVTPQLDGTRVQAEPVTEPIPGVKPAGEAESVAGAAPMAPAPVRTDPLADANAEEAPAEPVSAAPVAANGKEPKKKEKKVVNPEAAPIAKETPAPAPGKKGAPPPPASKTAKAAKAGSASPAKPKPNTAEAARGGWSNDTGEAPPAPSGGPGSNLKDEDFENLLGSSGASATPAEPEPVAEADEEAAPAPLPEPSVERTSAADTSSSEARAVPMMRRTKK